MIRPYDRRATKGRRRRAARRLRQLVAAFEHAVTTWHRVALETGLNRAIGEAQRALASRLGSGNLFTFNVGA